MILLPPAPVQPLIYSTMPSYWANRPTLAMDGDEGTAFRSYHGMGSGDGFTVILSRPVAARAVRIETGTADGADRLEGASLDISADGTAWAKASDFKEGVAEARPVGLILAVRIRVARGGAVPSLVVREIKVDTDEPMAPAQMGPPRGFVDVSGFPDLKDWAARAEAQMESFWPDTAALLYSKGFVTPNAVYVVYRTGPGVTPVAATGGGVMEVNAAWCRKQPNDTGLTVHETAHVVQSGGAPGWLVEAVADYIRWVRFEPQNFTFRIAPNSRPQQPYRGGAAFLGWCENHYDPWLVTQLNDACRFGRYSDALFDRYCGKGIDALWKEFLADYAKDPKGVLNPPVPDSMRPRALPAVSPGSGRPVEMPYDTIGITADGTKVRTNGGFDGEGSTFSATAMGSSVTASGVTFRLGPVGSPNVLAAHGQTVALSGRHRSLWILAGAVEGGQRDQAMTVTYADGTMAKLAQSFSDWFEPEGFPGEIRAVRMAYRNLPDGSRDERPFQAYAYGFPLDGTKELRSVALPDDPNIRVLALSTAD